jgi:hypothetical protein
MRPEIFPEGRLISSSAEGEVQCHRHRNPASHLLPFSLAISKRISKESQFSILSYFIYIKKPTTIITLKTSYTQ